mmetsp:Transcript_11872/g.27661  ORF Transcript_11872/g.27661 Transcript_11872/m.27661 type:complete len:241 (-) Transcript_11872:23-745(-)
MIQLQEEGFWCDHILKQQPTKHVPTDALLEGGEAHWKVRFSRKSDELLALYVRRRDVSLCVACPQHGLDCGWPVLASICCLVPKASIFRAFRDMEELRARSEAHTLFALTTGVAKLTIPGNNLVRRILARALRWVCVIAKNTVCANLWIRTAPHRQGIALVVLLTVLILRGQARHPLALRWLPVHEQLHQLRVSEVYKKLSAGEEKPPCPSTTGSHHYRLAEAHRLCPLNAFNIYFYTTF